MAKAAKKDFRDYVLADATVSAKLGTRMYPSVASKPAGTSDPYAVYTIVSNTADYTHNGTSTTVGRTLLVQIDIFSGNAVTAEETGDAIRARVESTKFSQGATEFGSVFLDTAFDNFEDATRDDGSSGLFRKTIQFRIKINT
tara:strand:+ start:1400 stop:1825 length:426 start_codon:yes stop_codon:yes gene_type:complete